ncbi:DUF3311 domain-containing protein [Alicyclobacillus macrosporangiidus]|uniref:DUF3311 domain-containing protein n=1 Tax=Alicyclobacillus macrosporangiidus TaxID=392015 RepID=UPI00049798D7|nr:DUF3311 domain-containing protein [Alicyclobacillus macrosporangiidus]MCL6597548.1 DUF3311 domain-containing protein [Alicyclobacillus macrosporangiidus]
MRRLAVFFLFIIPFLAQLVALPWVNRIHPMVLGFPLLHFWLLIWMLLTPLFTLAIHWILRKEAEA